jgi:hypothetical protein
MAVLPFVGYLIFLDHCHTSLDFANQKIGNDNEWDTANRLVDLAIYST